MKATAVIAPAQLAYVSIPADELRSFVDGLFPRLAQCSDADIVTGAGHRYMAGHDLLIDVPRTISESGVVDGTRHAGHILLTDFPTKAGIPIPGFSESGLGHLLEQAGIHRGWLQLNFCEAGLGIIAVAEGTPDLIQAINGTMLMHCSTFFDTFVEGGIEVGLAMATENTLLLAGGIENLAAGFISAWHTYVVHVDPLLFFGSAATSALIGFTIASGIVRTTLGNAAIAGIRSGILGLLFAVSPAFGFGALAGFVIYTLGGKLASLHNSSVQSLLSIDEDAYIRLLDELCKGNVNVRDFLDKAMPQIKLLESSTMLPTEYESLCSNVYSLHPLSSDSVLLADYYQAVLSESTLKFPINVAVFKDE